MNRIISNICDKAFVVLGAILFMQLPMYMHLYQQELIGRVAELNLQVSSMKQAAKDSGKNLEYYVTKFRTNEDVDVASQGKIMHTTVQRWSSLSQALRTLQNSNVFTKPWFFMYYFNFEIGRSVLQNFQLGLTFNIEALVYALAGMYIGFFAFLALRTLIRFLFYKTPIVRKI